MHDALVGLFADARDLGLGPLADRRDIVVGLLAQVGRLVGGRGVDVLDVGLGVRAEAGQGVGAGALGRDLHGLREIGHELVLLAYRRGGGGRLADLGGLRHGLRGDRQVVASSRGVVGGGRGVDHGGRLGLLVVVGAVALSGIEGLGLAGRRLAGGRVGSVPVLAPVRAPREPEAGLGVGRGHALGSSVT